MIVGQTPSILDPFPLRVDVPAVMRTEAFLPYAQSSYNPGASRMKIISESVFRHMGHYFLHSLIVGILGNLPLSPYSSSNLM